MPNVYSYIDFRKYLNDFIAEKKIANPKFSIRLMAQKVGISPGTLVRILSGKRNLSPPMLPQFISILKLRERAADYFSLLVEFDQQKQQHKKNGTYEKILAFRNERIRKIPETQYAVFDEWYYGAVRELVIIHGPCKDYRDLGPLLKPQVSLRQLKKAVQVLLSAGLVRKREDGALVAAERFLTTGERWENFAVQRFQKAMIDRALIALAEDPKEERDFSTLTVGLRSDSLQQVRAILKKTRQEILDLAESMEKPEIVYQINFQAFRISELKARGL